jgi:hypothetical protein
MTPTKEQGVGRSIRKRVADVLGIPLQLPAFLGYALYAACAAGYRSVDRARFENDSIYLLGSGPSLDRFDLGSIESSTVIFLNSAVDVHKKVPGSNRALWLCADVNAFQATAGRVPEHILRIVTVHRFDKALRVIRQLDRRRDHFILPRPSIRRKYPFRDGPEAGRLYFRPRYAVRNGRPVALDSLDDGLVYPGTVMLLAIAIALLLARKSIHLVGFDMGAGPGDYSRMTDNAAVTNPDRFSLETIELFLAEFRRQGDARGIGIYNHSPYAPERVLLRGPLTDSFEAR